MLLAYCASVMQEKSEQHSEAYIEYAERAAEVLPQQDTANSCRVLSSAQEQARVARRQK